MFQIKTIEIEAVETATITDVEMVDRYFWSSRSVYAVEFRKNIYGNSDQIWNEVSLTRVKFEKSIILNKKIIFNDKHPLAISKLSNYEDWQRELLHALVNDGYFDDRTKEQFDNDFNAAISHLQSIRK